jgi:hypothetical protein
MRSLFDITGLVNVFPVAASRDEAVESVRAA